MGSNPGRARHFLAAGLLAAALATAAPGGAASAVADSLHDGGGHGGGGHGADHGAAGHDAQRGEVGPTSDIFAVTVRRVSATGDRAKEVTYEAEVRNRTGQEYPGAEIVQMLPSDARLLATEPTARAQQDWLIWGEPFKAKGRATVRTTFVHAESGERAANGEPVQSHPVVCVRPDPHSGFSGCGGVARPSTAPTPPEQEPATAHEGGGSSDGKPVIGNPGSKATTGADAAPKTAADSPSSGLGNDKVLMAVAAVAGAGLFVVLRWRIRRGRSTS
ncbi:hypothetical protein [Streptomyces sp. NPDC002851]